MIITFADEETKHVAVLWFQTLFEGNFFEICLREILLKAKIGVLGVSNLLAIWEENMTLY